MPWLIAILVLLAPHAYAQKRILHIGHSAGFRHDSVQTSVQALRAIGERTAKFEVTATEDLSYITAERLREFDAVFFFTSGELPITDEQKADLLAFVRSGKGFGGAHSATDTLYFWPEYGEMIGGYFDDHPWVKEVSIDVEDPDFPGLKEFAPSFKIVDEIYQFRAFSRERVRVLTTLDTSTVDLTDPRVKRTDGDFALSWIRRYGEGRVFYTALGHFEETWTDPRIQRMLEGALLWMIGDVEADATPRPARERPEISAVESPAGAAAEFAPGSLIVIRGHRLTSGSTIAMESAELPLKLAGTRIEVNGQPIRLYSVSPQVVNAQLPSSLKPGEPAILKVTWQGAESEAIPLTIVESAPVVLSVGEEGGEQIAYVTGLSTTTSSQAILPGVWRMPLYEPKKK